MPVRVTSRGAERTSIDGEQYDAIICGASFAGLAAARELSATGARVLLLDRYEIGERQTSACAIPTPWLAALDLQEAARQELPAMRFTTPHGSVRMVLPWSWTAFDYRTLCKVLWAQSDGVEFVTAKVEGRGAEGVAEGETFPVSSGAAVAPVDVTTDRGTISAPLVLDAMGWRRVLDHPHVQPPDAMISRGLEVHPEWDASGDELHCWIDRGLIRTGYGWAVPAGGEVRVGVASYEPRDHVKQPTLALAEREGVDAVKFQGNWFPHQLREAASSDSAVFFAGDSAGHCFPLSGEGIRTALYFGLAAGREMRAVLEGRATRPDAVNRYAAFSAGHAGAYTRALRLQRLVPALPPRVLTALFHSVSVAPVRRRAFQWYYDQAPATMVGTARPSPVAVTPEPELAAV